MRDVERPDETPTVLVVEDDRELADTYEIWLESEYDTRVAYSGAEGLVWYDSDVDIVLLDRKMPDLSGTSVIQRMDQRDVADQRAVLTSAAPGRELVDLPCDEYLTKPVTKAELRDAIRELQLRSELDDELQRHFRLSSKIAALEKSDVRGSDEALDALKRQADQVRARIEDRISELDGKGEPYDLLETAPVD